MALDTVGLDNPKSAAASANEPASATFAKIAQASKSGSFIMPHYAKPRTDEFLSFLFP
jgi:hypothetical protein